MAGPGAVAAALTAARRFAELQGLAAGVADRLAVIVEEWVANVIEHGSPRPGSRIGLRLERVGEGVRITVTDAGIAFDPRETEESGPNLERGGGAGLALIRAWAEIEGYRRHAGRNRLVFRSRS